MVVKHIFRVDYHAEDAFPDGEEWIPDLTHIQDFNVFTQAVKFAQAHCQFTGAARIEQIDIDPNCIYGPEIDTDIRWECTETDCYRI